MRDLEFSVWFSEERQKCILFPVYSHAVAIRWRGPWVPREVLSWSQARTMQGNDAKSDDDWIYLRDASIYGKSRDTSRDIAGEVGEAHYSMCPLQTRQRPRCLKPRI